jgi:hypothetical protein
MVIGVSGLGVGRPATRAKAMNLYTGTFSRGLKTRFPGLKQAAEKLNSLKGTAFRPSVSDRNYVRL